MTQGCTKQLYEWAHGAYNVGMVTQKKQDLHRGLLLLLTAATGLVVANIYYSQPLLGLMAETYGVSELQISSISMITQIGYALGLFFIVPLGDKMKRKKLILGNFIILIAALLGAAFSQNPLQLKVASFFIGLGSVTAQVIIPTVAQMASDEKRGAAIGTVMTGLFIGILGSRTVSGVLGEYIDWPSIYLIAAAMMGVLAIILSRALPDIKPEFHGNYGALLRSIAGQFRALPQLRLASYRGALNFAGFSIFWTVIVFLLEEPPFNMGSGVAGTMGLVGIAGVIASMIVGKVSDKVNKNKLIMVGMAILLASWIIIGYSSASLIGLIIGAFLLDLGVQSVHITNQTIIFAGNPTARSRINTAYMTLFFIGGSLGTFIGGSLWYYFRWQGVVAAGIVLTVLVTAIHIAGAKRIHD